MADEIRPLLESIVDLLPVDVQVGYDLVGELGEELANTGLVSKGANWCFLAPWQMDSATVFEQIEWTVLNDMAELKAFLEQ